MLGARTALQEGWGDAGGERAGWAAASSGNTSAACGQAKEQIPSSWSSADAPEQTPLSSERSGGCPGNQEQVQSPYTHVRSNFGWQMPRGKALLGLSGLYSTWEAGRIHEQWRHTHS